MIIVDPPLDRVARARIGFGVVGIGLIAAGGVFALREVPPEDYTAVLLWLVAVVAVHDGIIAPLVAFVALRGAATARRIGVAAATVARTALCAAAVCALIAVPGIVVRALGPRNPTIHVTDYVAVVAGLWCVAILIAGAAVVVGSARQRRARTK